MPLYSIFADGNFTMADPLKILTRRRTWSKKVNDRIVCTHVKFGNYFRNLRSSRQTYSEKLSAVNLCARIGADTGEGTGQELIETLKCDAPPSVAIRNLEPEQQELRT